MDLEKELKKRLETKPILLMTHLVLGYPSLFGQPGGHPADGNERG